MNIAWFRPRLEAVDVVDDAQQLIDALSRRHTIAVFEDDNAHEFVWRHHAGAFDVIVYQLDDSRASGFMWAYLLRYPGLLVLRTSAIGASRRALLAGDARSAERRRETAFDGGYSMLRAPIAASRMVVVAHRELAEALSARYPSTPIRHAASGLRQPSLATAPSDTVFGVIAGTRSAGVVARAVERARALGVSASVRSGTSPRMVLESSNVVVTLVWPPEGRAQADIIAAMASARVPIVLETSETSDWPSLNPQTWQPWQPQESRAPICVSLDPRDEEHSLVLTIKRLATEAELRRSLAAAAQAWWAEHFTIERSADAMDACLRTAAALPPPPIPEGWPRHLRSDHSDTARAILHEFGLTVDVLDR